MASVVFSASTELEQPTQCQVCWKIPGKPPHAHDPKRTITIPKTKDRLIEAINNISSSDENYTLYTVAELRHIYSTMIGKKAHAACPLVGMAQLHKDELIQLCEKHGIFLGEGKFKKADYCLALRKHWLQQCELASTTTSSHPKNHAATVNENHDDFSDDHWSYIHGDDEDEHEQGRPKLVTRVIVELHEHGQSSRSS